MDHNTKKIILRMFLCNYGISEHFHECIIVCRFYDFLKIPHV